MTLRNTLFLPRLVATIFALGAVACVVEPESDEDQTPGGAAGSVVDGPTCFTEDAGCGCDPGTPPVTCTHTEARGDLVLCEAGAMYCVDGVWSECDTVHSWEMPRPKLISAPGACSPCNPDCFETDDEPDQTDIDSPPDGVTSNNVEFTLGPPRGIRPIPTVTMSMGGVDTDMDGVPDSADDCPTTPGTTAFFGCPTGAGGGGFFHVLPPGASAQDPLTFNVKLTEADIYIMVDTTGSMGDEINNLRTGLTSGVLDPACPTLTGVIGAIRCTIPGTWFGVGRFDDYPVSPYGRSSYNDEPYIHLLDLTSSTSAAQTAVNSLNIHNGNDIPESNSQALYAMASGNGLSFYGTQYVAPRTGCPAGRWGYPCFRPNVIPIVIMITDARFHNGPAGNQYAGTTLGAVNGGSLGNNNNTVDIGEVTGGLRSFTGSTSSATNNFTKRCGSSTNDNSRDRLIEFTVATTAQIIIDLSGSSFDTYISLYSGTSPTGGFIACDDDSGSDGRDSRLVRTLSPGTYTLRIDGHSSDQGNFELKIGETITVPGGVPYSEVVAAMNARNIRVIGVNSGPSSAENDLRALAADTDSLDGSGNAFVENISSNGSGLSTAIVDAVVDLANFSRLTVDVVVENVDLLPGIPASALVQAITLGAPGCAGGCTGAIPNGCSQCLPGTNLPFSVTFNNNVIMPTMVDQVFNFDIIVRGNLGAIELQRVPVRIVVPANLPATTYMSGSFSRTFDASDTCAIPPTRPDWGLFQWEVSTPGTTNVVFQFRTAESEAELDAMSPITYSVPSGPDMPTAAQFIDVGALITSMGGQNYLPYMRVTAVLNPNAAGTEAPTLTTFGLQYGCVDSE